MRYFFRPISIKQKTQEEHTMENYTYNSSALLIIGMLIGIVCMLVGM